MDAITKSGMNKNTNKQVAKLKRQHKKNKLKSIKTKRALLKHELVSLQKHQSTTNNKNANNQYIT